MELNMSYDVVIVGGGPAGLTAALNLGRARRRVLLCDAGQRRNALAEHIHGFVTRDGTPPNEFRRIARQQLQPYPDVEARDVCVEEIRGGRGAFEVRLEMGTVEARRVLLTTGMIDELPDIEGFRSLWGKSIFSCPYCHAWEVQDRRFAFLAANADVLDFALLLRGWTNDVVVLTNDKFDVSDEAEARLAAGGVPVERRPIARLAPEDRLERVGFVDGDSVRVDVLFARPPQRQVTLVQSLGVELDPAGYVRIDDKRQTSIPGIYAGGDLVAAAQSATLAAASGVAAAASLNHELSAELATAEFTGRA